MRRASRKGRRKSVDGTSSATQGLRIINSRTRYFYDGEEIIRSSLPMVDENSFSSSSLIIVLD